VAVFEGREGTENVLCSKITEGWKSEKKFNFFLFLIQPQFKIVISDYRLLCLLELKI
jgi:hypothetical protein